MDEEKIFYLKWKGRESGAYSAQELREMLALGKIGYLHLVRTRATGWEPLKDADLSEMASRAPASAAKKTDAFALLLYAAAGTAFLSPWVLAVCAALSAYAYSIGERRAAAMSFALAVAIGLCGYFFFGFVFPAIVEG